MKVSFLIICAAIFVIGFAVFHAYSKQDNSERKVMTGTPENAKTATFAGGCFWCSESDLEKAEGVIEVISGYTGGEEENPTYREVAYGKTSHYEAVQVTYDPEKISYETLLDLFWRHIDPTDDGAQFVDRGNQYRTAIFYHDDEQRRVAEKSKSDLQASGRFANPIVTEVRPLKVFYPAEEYHQDYYEKNPIRYKMYRAGSGRDQFIERHWAAADKPTGAKSNSSAYSRPDDATIKATLNPLQYRVTQEDGTEQPFNNEYWNNKEEGIYVDIVSGEPLLALMTSSSPVPAGQVLHAPWSMTTSSKSRTVAYLWCVLRSGVGTETPILAMFSRMDRRPPVCGIVSILRRCGLFPRKISKKRGMASIRGSLKRTSPNIS